MNIGDLMTLLLTVFFATLRQTTPLLLTALGGLFSERSGVTNIALEGMILFGALSSAITVERLEVANGGEVHWWIPWVGLLAGGLLGGLVGWVHAIAAIKFRADQIISATAINMAALGIPAIVLQVLYNNTTSSNEVQNRLPAITIFGDQKLSVMVVVAFLAVPVVWWVLFKTPWGLRLRAVGENPEAAQSVGINVYRTRYTAVILSGVMAGLAGGYLSIGFLNQFVSKMSAGLGFIALAALIFGKWHPIGVLGSTMLFGLFSALAIILPGLEGWDAILPQALIQAMPYVLTILVLAGFIGRSRPPGSVGKPF